MTNHAIIAQPAAGFTEADLEMPVPLPFDLIVRVEAVSLNPVDLKRHENLKSPTVLGYDAVGIIRAAGARVTNFKVGERVFYAGTTQRPGSNQAYQAIDARLVAKAPEGFDVSEIAALPLVSLTAWELLFEKMRFIPEAGANADKTLLVINGAGGVGSVLTQLAAWSGLTVLATASPKNHAWLTDHSVTTPIDYHQDLIEAVHNAGHETLDGIAILYNPEAYTSAAGELIKPFGHVGTIVGPGPEIDLAAIKNKAASLDFEYMFAKSDSHYQIETQGEILTQISTLVSKLKLTSPVTKVFEGLTIDNMAAAAQLQASGHQVGKIVITLPH